MVNWDDLRTTLELVRGGSLAEAAARLGVNYTTVARRVSRLEKALGEPLFERFADGYRPTDAALLVAERAGAMQVEEDTLLRALKGRDDRLEGALTITAPQLVIAHLLCPTIGAFCATHPGVEIHTRATNDILDLSRREADLAIRVSRSPGDALIGLRLTEQHTASFAHPDWAARIEGNPEGAIDWIVYSAYDHVPEGVLERFPGSLVRYRFDDMIAMVGAAEAGLGVARLPMFLGRISKTLVQVSCLPPQPYADIWAVAHADVWPSAKSTAFRETLKAHLPAIRALCQA